MSIIAMREGCEDRLVPVQAEWTPKRLAKEIKKMLQLRVPVKAVLMRYEDRELDSTDDVTVLGEVLGIRGCEERIEVRVGDHESARAALAKKGLTGAPDNWATLFQTAVATEDAEVLELLVMAQVLDVGQAERAMHGAVEEGLSAKVELLVQCGVSARGGLPAGGETYAAAAARCGESGVLRFLLEEEGVLPALYPDAFIAALSHAQEPALELLLSSACTARVPADALTPVLLLAAWHLSDAAVQGAETLAPLWKSIPRLVDAGADVNARVDDESHAQGATAAMLAARGGSLPTVMRLAEQNANLHATDAQGTTALIHAAAQGNVDVVRFLVAKNCNVNRMDGAGTNSLCAAVHGCDLVMVRTLLELGCSPDGGDAWDPPLLLAARTGHLEIVRLLLDAGADTNAQNAEQHTPLIVAAAAGHYTVVRVLVKRGADVNSRTRCGRTSQILAMERGHVEVYRYLCKKAQQQENCLCCVA
eukprot:TRINITY_DN6784_c0_g2_i1.p1 TRINITY_DN6784_c0_g2~~TRINITY_DN6784_c0_g2_i1.p1  ORF type:complete len:477 (+),score=157.28 TRINITY_DN6784_c0_g2_i1:66-1496(+)